LRAQNFRSIVVARATKGESKYNRSTLRGSPAIAISPQIQSFSSFPVVK
jgi:hypothetical protein